ncbi:MAG: N-acetyltransferase [Rhodanobacteraceae bacterium]|nr:MAG: N-acetyltransferase [Rhodanobacteraceae bacterium]
MPSAVPSPEPVLETERLILRLPQRGDFERYAEAKTDPDGTRYTSGVLSRPEAWRKFLEYPGAWMLQGFAMFSVVEKSSGLWIGIIGPWQPEGWQGTEVGWSLHRSAWGKGYAYEAAEAAIDWSFDVLGWQEVIHSINPDNVRSQALAQRLGSRKRGSCSLPPPRENVTVDIWGQTREEWLARRARQQSSDHQATRAP